MKRCFFVILATKIVLVGYSQSVVDFTKFPVRQNDTATLFTTDLLDKINWQAIKSFCKTAQGHYAYENKDSLLTSYKYVKQGYESSFEIISYKGTVLEFYADAGNAKQENKISYFDKNVWLKYVSEMLPNLPDQFKLTKGEPNNISKAYYRLLGVNTEDEYGFICEYSAAGMATDRRMAVIELLREHRIDLIRNLIEYPNLQTKLYAIDALIYEDYTAKQKFIHIDKEIRQNQKQLDRLQKKNVDRDKVEDIQNKIKLLTDSIPYNSADTLTDGDWQIIYKLRDSNQTVKTCGNAGSYKIYRTPISELLSDEAIANIPKRYEGLKSLGYFR